MTCLSNSKPLEEAFLFFCKRDSGFSVHGYKKAINWLHNLQWLWRVCSSGQKPQIYTFLLNINPKYFLPLYLNSYLKDTLKKNRTQHFILKLSLNSMVCSDLWPSTSGKQFLFARCQQGKKNSKAGPGPSLGLHHACTNSMSHPIKFKQLTALPSN